MINSLNGIDDDIQKNLVELTDIAGNLSDVTVFRYDIGVIFRLIFYQNQNTPDTVIYIGIDVILTNGKFTKNINREKTDVLDCQWIQKLQALGLLPSSLLPGYVIEKLRTLCGIEVR